jgi:hypothetical protein
MYKPIQIHESFKPDDTLHCNFRITRTHNEQCWRSGIGSEWFEAVPMDGKTVVLVVSDLIRRHPCQRFAVWYRWRMILRYDWRAGIRIRNYAGENDWDCWSRKQLDCEKAIKQELAIHHRRLLQRSSRVRRKRSSPNSR